MATDNGGAISSGGGGGGGGAGGSNGEHDLSDSLKPFGAVLKALREEARLTQEEFAQRVQYSTAYVAKIEQGKRFPPSDLPSRAEPALGAAAAKVLGAAARSLTAQETSVLITDPKSVSAMLQRYGKMRSQALSRTATASLLKQMRGAL